MKTRRRTSKLSSAARCIFTSNEFLDRSGVAVSARMIDRNSIGLDQDWEESKLPSPVPFAKKSLS